MSKRSEINKKTEDILNSLDGIRRASAQPFLYTRVMARLSRNTTTGWERMASLISRPAVAFAAITLFLLINAAVVFHFSTTTTASTAQDESAVVSDNEYSLSVSSLYDINPEQNDVAQK